MLNYLQIHLTLLDYQWSICQQWHISETNGYFLFFCLWYNRTGECPYPSCRPLIDISLWPLPHSSISPVSTHNEYTVLIKTCIIKLKLLIFNCSVPLSSLKIKFSNEKKIPLNLLVLHPTYPANLQVYCGESGDEHSVQPYKAILWS